MKYRVTRARPGRSVNDRIHHIKTFTVAALAILIAGALESTWLSRMPWGLKGSPALLLLVVITLGYWFGEQAGALGGLFAGIVADLSVSGMMLTPMIFMLCGYVCGIGSRRFLARNLPSFLIFCLCGVVWNGLYYLLKVIIGTRGFPPAAFFLADLLPCALLTVLVSPLFYVLAKGYAQRKKKSF